MVVTAPLILVPNRDDIASSIVCVGASMAMKGYGEPFANGLEQIISVILARNIAARVESTDRTDPAGATIKEYDAYTGALRSGYSAYKGQANKTIAVKGLHGVLCNVIGRELIASFFPDSSA